ncbi:MAG: putative bifunctional DNA primase/polymerase [Prokaryotic dsDNA virus sp.]|nr:MAG: putative bifunctional DNA primase/polymerase [Prokaryotic dsDNA virus sp.]|tara:strand:+ start:2565 stop:3479 length:915 start_codon:yes stop_codon:yes gene_type:complete
MLINVNKTIEHLDKIRSGKIKEGLKLEIPEIDQFIRFKPTNFNVILGHANVGKTTLILYLMLLYTKKHGLRWLIFSSENEAYSILRKLIEFLELQPLNKIEPKNYKKHIDYINNHFKIIDSSELYTYKTLLETANNVKSAWDYNGLLIDPYNSLIKDHALMKGVGSHEYDYQATSEIRIFCKTKNVSVWLNTHANTNALRIKHPIGHDFAGHPIPPLASDVEGGGKFVNRSDDFWVIHRYLQHPTDWVNSAIHVRKVKEVETGGRPTPIDEPIKLSSIPNNVGFEINGKRLLEIPLKDKDVVPF